MNTLTKRAFVRCLPLAAAMAFVLPSVHAQSPAAPAPSSGKTMRLVVSFAPGGAGDFLARLIQQKLQERLGQTVIVENRPGASGTIGADLVAKAAPDGNTVLITNQLVVQAPNLISKMPYDPQRDLVPVVELGGAPLIFAVNVTKTNATTLKDFFDEVRKNPKTYSYASVGQGSIGHLYGVVLNDQAKTDLMHVPYKGSAPVVMALVAGEVQSAFSDYATMKPHIESGKLRLLGVSRPYGPTPNVPTFTSLGYKGLESYSWIGMFMPAKTPNDKVQQLSQEVNRIIKMPEVSAKLQEMGLEMPPTTQEQFAAMVNNDFKSWAVIMKTAGIKPE
ncbi:Bug family tripartite tricarboxylate transporter substrate binding protein [Hydrogenophaga sp. BPS33]|uniref:Bug family tripartite tricarboxylate transporter substrate binding protein n=1 Tax=Hydrogenophaga sp. BPS33 TaxID=2651974 RepID=UPI00131FE34E|nr:tripartite tricarboxylate transporter substrate binding protein [Hydrogenophaga sp. BPS33]QHE87405.1 tripartite tricarboxylate transporter substrate binding protein [Hydrogenophaga sp. BPS33]